ncbi:MAG: hypothetical protein R3F61_24065 [Myxococcota bacterium]
MRFIRFGAVAVVVGFALACGGVSVEPRAHLEQVCAAAGSVFVVGPLVTVDLPKTDPSALAIVEIEPGGATFEGGLSDQALTEAVERARSVAQYSGQEVVVALAIAPETPIDTVWAALTEVHDLGVTGVELLFHTSQALSVPPYPDPAYAADLKSRISSVDAPTRMMKVAEEMESLVTLCPGAQMTFQAIANASPESKCVLMAAGLGESLPSCPLTSGDKVVTLAQIITEPGPDGPITAVSITLDPGAEPFALGEGTWADASAAVVAADGKRVRPTK